MAKGYEKWADEATKKLDPDEGIEDFDYELGWIAGFKAARERIASFVEQFNTHGNGGLAKLIRAIGEADIEQKEQERAED